MNVKLIENTDLTEILNVEKYDTEEGETIANISFKLNPKKSYLVNKFNYFKWVIKSYFKRFNTKSRGGNFPTSLVPKTDQKRIQAFSKDSIESFKGKSFTIQCKMDGSSLTILNNNGKIIVCSRNLALGESKENKFWQAIYKYDLKSKMKSLKNFALQMELIGEGIQGNRYAVKGYEIRLFDVFDIKNKKYLTSKEMVEIANKLNIPHVVIIDENFIFNKTIDELVTFSTKKSVENPKVWEEGYVFKMNDDNTSFKVINPEYLLEKDKKEKG